MTVFALHEGDILHRGMVEHLTCATVTAITDDEYADDWGGRESGIYR